MPDTPISKTQKIRIGPKNAWLLVYQEIANKLMTRLAMKEAWIHDQNQPEKVGSTTDRRIQTTSGIISAKGQFLLDVDYIKAK